MNVVVKGNMLKNVRRLIIFSMGRGLNKDNSANFLAEKKINEAFRVSIFRTWEYANKL